MKTRASLMWLLLAVLVLAPLSGAFIIGPVELLVWTAMLMAWVVVFRTWARRRT